MAQNVTETGFTVEQIENIKETEGKSRNLKESVLQNDR